ncbi:MAG: FAD-dependent oxidoreductase [Acidimicrobiia bacterium]|nr:FAD-dependent oxidoreductase [Acidimicrobiia bacterium]
MPPCPRILVVGGGAVGMNVALRLQRRLRPGEAEVTVVDTTGYLTYQPFLPEAAAGSLEPRHVVVPLRRVLRRSRVVTGTVTAIRHADRVAHVELPDGEGFDLSYDVLVCCPGSVARALAIPGLGEVGIGFKTVAEAIYLRNRVLRRLELAASTPDPATRARALTFVFVGGGYAGIEALAELESMARDALRFFPGLDRRDLRWVLVEATDRILPEVSAGLGRSTLEQLRRRGIDVRLGTRLRSAVGGHVVLDDGTELDADTLVWTAGVRAHPLVERSDLPRDERGRIRVAADLAIDGADDAWAAGDSAAVPDLTGPPGATCAPSAQHAVRQAVRLADNLVASLRGEPTVPYRHAYVGSVASLGLYRGAAELYGVRIRGFPAWWLHRTYHLARLPTWNRRLRVIADWTLALLFRREIVSLGEFANPRRDFRLAAELAGTGDGPAARDPQGESPTATT